MKALLLCAGLGSRLQLYTQNQSKMAISFLNLPIVSYPLWWLHQFKVKELLVNTHFNPKEVEDVVRTYSSISHVDFSYEPQLLGGAGTLFKNKDFFKEDFIYLNGDSVFLSSLFLKPLIEEHKKNKSLITFLVSSPSSNKKVSLINADFRNNVQSITNSLDVSSSQETSAHFFPGLAILSPKVFSYLKQEDTDIFKDLLPRIKDKAKVYEVEDLMFFEVGVLEEYFLSVQKAIDILHNGNPIYQNCLKQIFQFYSCHNQIEIFPQGKMLYENSIQGIDNIEVTDFAVVGKNTQFKNKVHLKRAVINQNREVSQDIENKIF